MNLLLINDSDQSLNEEFLQKWVKAVSSELISNKVMTTEQGALELSVVFLKEADAKQLNWNYRQKDYATDVLSFETDDPGCLGELVLCPTVLDRQAKEHELSFDHEAGYMILHGILHLLGYDHEKDEEESRLMLSLQDHVFDKLTAPPPKPAKAVKATRSRVAPKKKAAAKPTAKKATLAKKPKTKRAASR